MKNKKRRKMNNVKKYNIGEIKVDLTKAKMTSLPPYVQYTYELPLFSFGDARDAVSLSLVFNYEKYKKDIESGENPFFIAPGYKLNMQKHIICNQNEVPTTFCGDIGNAIQLLKQNDSTYTFVDESKRILRRTPVANSEIITPGGSLDVADGIAYKYTIEYADFSKEEYNTAGRATETVDKYGNTLLSYEYDTDRHMTSVTFKDSKIITIEYESNRIKYVIYGNKTVEFCYNTDGSLGAVKHYTGVNYSFTLSNVEFSTSLANVLHKCNFRSEAVSSGSNIHLCSKELKMLNAQTLTVSDKIGNNTVNSLSHRAAINLLDCNLTGKYFDVIDNNGATVRTWVEDGEKLYSYPILDSIEQFSSSEPQGQFLGNVSVNKALNQEGNISDFQITGIQARDDGILLNYNSANYQWSREIGNSDGGGGYYILSGWIKSNEVSYDTIHIHQNSALIASHTIELMPFGEWGYFCILFVADVGEIKVYADTRNKVSTHDFRITPIKTNTQVNNKNSHVGTTEYVLFNGNTEIPYTDVSFGYTKGGADTIIGSYYSDEGVTVTSSDILRYKLRKKKTGLSSEVYYNDCKGVISGTTDFKVLYNGSYISIDNFDVGTKVYSGNNISVTRINFDEDNHGNILKTCTVTKKTQGANGDVTMSSTVSSELYRDDLDLIRFSADGVITEYVRDSQGSVINESVGGLYTRTTNYGTNSDGEPTVTVTDEFNNSTVYTYDSVWGTVKSVRLPSGEIVYNTYDGNMSALTEVSCDSGSARANSFGYSGGRFTSVTDGELSFGFEYSSATGDLVGITKNGASVEQHTYIRNNGDTTVQSSYPSVSNPINTETVVVDKYNRTKSVENILQNTYGATEESIDYLVGEKKTYVYKKNKLKQVLIKATTGSQDNLRQEEFAYDNAERLNVKSFYYDVDAEKNVVSNIGYLVSEADPRADGRISSYSYRVNGSEKARTENAYDVYKRLISKNVRVGARTYSRSIEYDKTRVNKVTDSTGVTRLYEYDSVGRITKEKDAGGNIQKAYIYDTYGQLIRENNKSLDKTYVYEYNNLGNLVNVKTYPYTEGTLGTVQGQKSFYYDLTYPDRLVLYGSTSVSYNAMGCPMKYEGYTAGWTRGKLTSLTMGSGFNVTNKYTFSYNSAGHRVEKKYVRPTLSLGGAVMKGDLTECTRTYCYDESGRLISEHVLSKYYQEDSTVEDMIYLYDTDTIVGVVHTSIPGTTATYYFERNLFGDVVGIYDANGNKVGAYAYDAWGNCTTTLSTIPIVSKNPIRYRGYYYDAETKLYYLGARYYCPEWHRFISPDDTGYLDPETPNGLNLYVYCNNDPVNYVDPTGKIAILSYLFAAVISGAIFAGTNALGQVVFDGATLNSIDWRKVTISGISGFVSGLISGSGFVSIATQAIVTSFVENGLATVWLGEDLDFGVVAKDIISYIGTSYLIKTSTHFTSKITSKIFHKASNYSQYQHHYRKKGYNYSRQEIYRIMENHQIAKEITDGAIRYTLEPLFSFLTYPI